MTGLWIVGIAAACVDVCSPRRWPVVTLVLLAVLALAAAVIPAVRADAAPSAQLALAQVCASEASVQTETDDCAAIAQVLIRRAKGRPLAVIAARYSSRVFDRKRTDARRWVAHLRPSRAQPRGWPSTLPWKRWRGRWAALYRHAGAILRGDVPSPCERPPDHWGGEMDDWRARKAGWSPVDCGETFNHFWAVPRRDAS